MLTVYSVLANEKTAFWEIFIQRYKGSFGPRSENQSQNCFLTLGLVFHTPLKIVFQWIFSSFLYQNPLITVEFLSSNLHSESYRRTRIRCNVAGHLFQTCFLWTKLKKKKKRGRYFFNPKQKETKRKMLHYLLEWLSCSRHFHSRSFSSPFSKSYFHRDSRKEYENTRKDIPGKIITRGKKA